MAYSTEFSKIYTEELTKTSDQEAVWLKSAFGIYSWKKEHIGTAQEVTDLSFNCCLGF